MIALRVTSILICWARVMWPSVDLRSDFRHNVAVTPRGNDYGHRPALSAPPSEQMIRIAPPCGSRNEQ